MATSSLEVWEHLRGLGFDFLEFSEVEKKLERIAICEDAIAHHSHVLRQPRDANTLSIWITSEPECNAIWSVPPKTIKGALRTPFQNGRALLEIFPDRLWTLIIDSAPTRNEVDAVHRNGVPGRMVLLFLQTVALALLARIVRIVDGSTLVLGTSKRIQSSHGENDTATVTGKKNTVTNPLTLQQTVYRLAIETSSPELFPSDKRGFKTVRSRDHSEASHSHKRA